MCFVTCFDAVTMVIDEATKRFGVSCQEDADKKHALQEACEMIESLAIQFNGVAYKTEVNDETTEILITLTCTEFETNIASSKFCELIERAKKITFKTTMEDSIDIGFLFDGIWTLNK